MELYTRKTQAFTTEVKRRSRLALHTGSVLSPRFAPWYRLLWQHQRLIRLNGLSIVDNCISII
ncbi:hypothetical protein OESDEN_24729 [Oesophagostomum dentatum]|uniref:Uncharacterized protein n=1 Tax=Oesophagostomum dentatum TaxID=61180 RepID=A0A0B1RXD4_OESDE|nr:hypothetical protein OESDEN_24729 [Oesophagostomum dentatum]